MTTRSNQDPNRPGHVSRPWEVILDAGFLPDLRYWIETDRRTALRLLVLIEAVARDPFHGIGKPELLRYLGSDVWSRRLNGEHRMTYTIIGDQITLLRARHHYRT